MTNQNKKNKKGFYDYLEVAAKHTNTVLTVGGTFLLGIATKAIADKFNNKS